MKKNLLTFTTLALIAAPIYSQLKVDSLGLIGIGGQTETGSQIKVETNAAYGLKVDLNRQNTVSAAYNEGIQVHVKPHGSYSYGVSSLISHPSNLFTSDYSVGCVGEVFGSTLANYGIVGFNDPSKHGAAIYGSPYLSYLVPNSALAALFWGPTRIEGDLMVSGTVNGIVLGAASASGSREQENLTRILGSAGENLKRLSTNTFYINERSDEYTIIENPHAEKFGNHELEETDMVKLEGMKRQIIARRHYGLDADQLEEVFPDLVYEDEDGTKSINYVEMVPILVQAINELSAKVEALESSNGSAKKIETRAATNVDEMGENVIMLALGQNKPNPFGSSTSIEVSIPDDVQSAFIYVYDLTGKKLQQVDIVSRGKQAITINASSLTDGMYLYSLIADGKVVETRRMIVEK